MLLLGGVACADGVGTTLDPVVPPVPEVPVVGFTVSGVSPAPSATSVDVRSPILVTFSQDLDSSTVQGALALTGGDRAVRGTLVLDGPATLRFEPSTPLEPGEEWRVRLASSLRSGSGTSLASALNWSFRTAGEPLGAPDAERFPYLISVLADDSLRGRGSGGPDEARAAEAIARDLEGAGVVPFGDAWLDAFAASTRETPPAVLNSRNVLGMVSGFGHLADEWVVVGAHYDHLGFVERADGTLSVYHGADDNASGTSVVMELARLWAGAVAGDEGGARRSVLFAFWGAEERGLLGSCAFVGSGALPADRIAAVLNFDMVGRLGEGALRVPVAEPGSAWWGTLADANADALSLDGTPGCTGCSDHFCFLEAARPVVFFHTGLHDDYHKPTDVAGKVDYPGLVRIAELALRALWRVAVVEGQAGLR